MIRRREFITLIGGAAVTWPMVARAQERVRRVGVLNSAAANDTATQARYAAFVQTLQQLGWIEGRNLNIDNRWAGGGAAEIRKHAAELVRSAPDVIFATGGAGIAPLLQETRALPLVFINVPDPVGSGFVDSLAHPGGNVTGFTPFEFGIAAKWAELLKEIAPGLARVAVIRDAAVSAGLGQFGAIQSVAPSLGLELTPINVRDPEAIERDLANFARRPNGGLILTPSTLSIVHRELIVRLAARHKLPAMYFFRFFATDGGLVSYGPDPNEQFRSAAGYVDRILKGEKPADMPVQLPTKYELAINLKTARALGLTVPATLLARADEVIE